MNQEKLNSIRTYLQDAYNEGDGHYPLTDTSEQILALFQPAEGELVPNPMSRTAMETGEAYACDYAQGFDDGRIAQRQHMIAQGWHPQSECLKQLPPIVCLCGSTRFVDTFNEWRKRLTCEGKIVLSIEIVTSQTKDNDPQHCNPELKQKLDELHLRKIDLATEVMVLNVGGYMGESTTKEVAYAQKAGKKITYLEPV